MAAGATGRTGTSAAMKLLLAFLLYISVAVASDFFDDDCNYSKTAAVNIGGTAVTCGHEYPLKLVSAPDIKVTFDEADAVSVKDCRPVVWILPV